MSIGRDEFMARAFRRYVAPGIAVTVGTFWLVFLICWAAGASRHDRGLIAFVVMVIVAVAAFVFASIGMARLSRSIKR